MAFTFLRHTDEDIIFGRELELMRKAAERYKRLIEVQEVLSHLARFELTAVPRFEI